MTTGATLFVIMDLALLLGMFSTCEELLLLIERLSSAVSPVWWSVWCVGVTAAGWDPALAVVPIVHTELQSDHTHQRIFKGATEIYNCKEKSNELWATVIFFFKRIQHDVPLINVQGHITLSSMYTGEKKKKTNSTYKSGLAYITKTIRHIYENILHFPRHSNYHLILKGVSHDLTAVPISFAFCFFISDLFQLLWNKPTNGATKGSALLAGSSQHHKPCFPKHKDKSQLDICYFLVM